MSTSEPEIIELHDGNVAEFLVHWREQMHTNDGHYWQRSRLLGVLNYVESMVRRCREAAAREDILIAGRACSKCGHWVVMHEEVCKAEQASEVARLCSVIQRTWKYVAENWQDLAEDIEDLTPLFAILEEVVAPPQATGEQGEARVGAEEMP